MNRNKIKNLVGISLLVAIVVVLQALGAFIKIGPFSISLTLVPIVVGSALYGPIAGAVLGFVFSVVVLVTDAAAFLAYSIPATVIVVLTKGTLAGYCAGLVYKLVEKRNSSTAVFAASVTAPIVNTGIFVIGCIIFFVPLLETWAAGTNVIKYIFLGMVGTNFLIEATLNICLVNVISLLIRVGKNN